MKSMIGILTLVAILGASVAFAETVPQKNASALKKLVLEPLTLGAIRPGGWLQRQLRIQADGLSGHLDEFWPDVRDSGWIGGASEGWERGPYWLDGAVPLAYTLDDAALKAKVVRWMDYILTHQREDGWLGPENSKGYKPLDPWPTFVVLKAMIQYQEATGDPRVIPAMLKSAKCLTEQMTKQPLFDWGKHRWMDLVWSMHWLYDRTEDPAALQLAELAHQQGFDWRGHFENFKYTDRIPAKDAILPTHGVNNAMSVKAGPVWFRQSKDSADGLSIFTTFSKLDKYHGQITGVFSGDEHYGGISPAQGSELCLVNEYLFSLETAMAIGGTGNATPGDWRTNLSDRWERIAYNALPGTFTKDMWAHQYDQQANQAVCRVSEDRPFATNGPQANLYGLEPNYGCCTANLSQGWPKFVKHLWMKTDDPKGIKALTYAPCLIHTEIDGKPVSIEVISEYPFDGAVEIHIQGQGTFAVALTIPGWAAEYSVTVDGDKKDAGVRTSASEHVILRDWSKAAVVQLTLPMKPRIERSFHDSVCVLRGPLVFALQIGQTWNKIAGEEPHADYEVLPTTPWNYGLALDPANPESALTFEKRPLVDYPFSEDGSPIRATVKGRLLPEWVLEHNAAAPPPQSPVASTQPVQDLTLVPYGAAKLRISAFPLTTVP